MSDPVDILKSVKATLNGRDLLELSSTIFIAEDLNSTFPRSMIQIARDPRYEMQEALAGNKLSITLQPQNGPALTVNHVVHSAKPAIHDGGKGLHGSIMGVDDDYSKFIEKRVTKAWDKKNTDEIIKEIYQEAGGSKKVNVSSGFKKASFTSPSLMPKQAIDKAGGLSQAGSKGFSFNTHENGGTANFKTLKDMASKGPKRRFTFNAAGAADMNSLGDPSVIFDLKYEGSPVSAQKQTNAQGDRYNPQFGKTEKNEKAGQGLSTPGLGVKAGDAQVGYKIQNTIEQERDEKRRSDRDQQNLNDYTAKLKILVPIATDLHAGDVIEVNSGSATYFSDASPTNAASGKWLIVAVMHTVHLGGNEQAPGHTGRTLLHCVGRL